MWKETNAPVNPVVLRTLNTLGVDYDAFFDWFFKRILFSGLRDLEFSDKQANVLCHSAILRRVMIIGKDTCTVGKH
jgi:hypothetical protein